jgi:type IV pilus assembly protein PilE
MKSKGFTLIELMVVVAIVGIIASITYPSYTGYISNTYQAQAVSDLKLCALALDRYYSNDFTYIDADDVDNPVCTLVSPGDAASGSEQYIITFVTLTSTNYVIKATPVGGSCGGKCIQLAADGTQTQL